MNKPLREQASALAQRPYTVTISQDASDEDGLTYIARNPELPRCLADGSTIEEAIGNLASARIEYILSLLEDGLPVPPPQSSSIKTGGDASTFTSRIAYNASTTPRVMVQINEHFSPPEITVTAEVRAKVIGDGKRPSKVDAETPMTITDLSH